LIPELEAFGHRAIAPDLPGSGGRRAERATLAGYRDTVVEALEPDDVLVGHSMAGYVITMAADVAAARIRHLVYLAAGVPVEGRSMLEATPLEDLGMERHVTISDGPHGPQFELNDVDAAMTIFFNDLGRELATEVFKTLTPQQLAPLSETISVPSFWSCAIPRSYILGTSDKSGVLPIAAEQLARLGLRSAYLMDTGHYPFIGKPRETAALLVEAVSVS